MKRFGVARLVLWKMLSVLAISRKLPMIFAHRLRAVVALTAVSFLCLASTSVLAGGLGLMEMGTNDLGLAGAGWAARAQDAATAFTNPAGMTRIKGNDLVLGAQLLYGHEIFSPNSNTEVPGNNGGNDLGWSPGASAHYVYSLSDDVKLGIGGAGSFGLGVKYRAGFVGRYFDKSGTLLGMNTMPSVAYRATDKLSIAAGPNIMLGYLKSEVKINNQALGGNARDGEMELKDITWGFGGTVGVMYEMSPQTRFGATYNSKIKLDFKDKPDFSRLGNIGTALNYAGLIGPRLEIGVTVPQQVMTSFYHDLNDQWAVMGNLGWQDWSETGKVDVNISTISLTTPNIYKDTWHIALGAQYQYSERWLLRSGFGYDSNVQKSHDTSIAAPLGSFWTIALGATYKVRTDFDVSFGYTLRYYPTLTIDQGQGTPATSQLPRVAGEFKHPMLHFFGLTFHWN